MSERRRRYTVYEIDRSDPVIEERRPEVIKSNSNSQPKRLTFDQRARSPVTQRRRTVIFTSTPVHSRRKERVERSPSPVRYVLRPRAPTPPPRSYTPLPPTIIMPPKQTPALKPILTSKNPPSKKVDNKPKSGTKPSDKSNEGPRVKIYEKTHRPYNSLDSGHASGFSSPWVEDRSPLDYADASPVPTTTPVPKSPKPRVDREAYEIITADSRPRYVKTGSDRTRDPPAPTTTERKKDARYVMRTPESPGTEAEIVPPKSSRVTRDGYASTQRATQVFQQQLDKEPERSSRPRETPQADNSQRLAAEIEVKQLEVDIQKMRLEQQIAEGRKAEAERRMKQQRQDELERERRGRELKQQQADEKRRREASLARRDEDKLARQQWDEIEATPRRPAPVVEQGQISRRHTLMTPYGSGALTTTTSTQPGSMLDTENPFLAPILEAQRDEDARRAREAKDGRRGMVVKETARSVRPRRSDRDDRYHK